MKTISYIFNLSILVAIFATSAYCQPKFNTVPNIYMNLINNNNSIPIIQSLPYHIYDLNNPNLYNPTNEMEFEYFASFDDDPMKQKYLGQKPMYAHQAINDKSGNLLFFIVDNYIYDKNGYGIEDPQFEEGYCLLHDLYNPYDTSSPQHIYHNIIVVPVPKSCNEFYIFYAMRINEKGQTSNTITPDLYYRKITFYTETDILLSEEFELSTDQTISGCDDDNSLSVTITDYDSEYENYLLVLHSSYDMYIFEIGESINTSYKKLYVGYVTSTEPPVIASPTLGQELSKRPDIVLFTKNNFIYYIFNGSIADHDELLYNKINFARFPRDFEQITPQNLMFHWTNYNTDYIIRGMECSPNKNYLYFTFVDAPGINYFDITNLTNNGGDIPATFSTVSQSSTDNFRDTDIELFRDGKLYLIRHDVATETGTYTSINNPNSPTTTTLTNNCFNTQTAIKTYSVNQYPKHKRYIFNHQIDNSDYETGYPVFASDQPNWNNIGSNVTWSPGAANNPFGSESGIVYFDEDFVIPSGKYVKLSNMEIYFANGKKAIVNFGSTLRLEGTKLTAETICTPTAMWNGIYLEGNSDTTQTSTLQGTLSMAAGSEISNAITGVTVEGGAICKIYAGDFVNNKTGISFLPYTHPSVPSYNASFIQLANFTINAALNNGNTPLYMINLSSVKGVNITLSNFTNSRGSNIAASSRGYAIRSFSSSFKLEHCNTEGWYYGCNLTSGTPRIIDNQFTNNYKSLYSTSGVSVEITENDFDGDYNFGAGTGTPYSVYVLGNGTNNTLYKFEENTIQNGVVGVQFNNLGPNAVKVKDNVFLNISGYTQSCAAVAIGKNSDFVNGSSTQIGEYGLEFRCNNFDDNPYALSVIDGNMRKYQGEFGASSGSDYAGNAFDHSGTNIARDFYVKVPINSYWEIPLYQYYSHSDNPHKLINEAPGVICSYSANRVSNNVGTVTFDVTHCEETDGGGIIYGMSIADGSEIVEQTDTEIMLKEFELEEATDDGNTYFLLSQTETMNVDNSVSVALDIAELDGYISDEVAITYMQNNSSNQFAKANALLENSPLPASVRNEVDNMEMNSSLKQIVKSQQNGVNNRDKKQIEIANLKQNRGLIINEMYKSAVNNDSVPTEKIALEQFLKNDNNFQSKLYLVDLYRFNQNFEEAGATLNEIKLSLVNEDINYRIEMENYIELEKVLLSIDAGDALLSDAVNANIELINFIAHKESYYGQATAQLLLQEAGIEEFEEIIKLPELVVTKKNASISEKPTLITESSDIINIYPNPASEVFYVEYALFNQKQSNTIQILNLNGSVIETYELKQQVGLFVYNKKLSPGTYIIKVGENYTQKLTIK